MSVLEQCYPVIDIWGEKGTNAGGMLERVRIVMAQLTNQDPKNIKIQDLLAVNTFVPQKVKGGIAEEFSMENAIGLAAMVKADKLQMEMIAMELQNKINKKVVVGGVEAEMAIIGALTTPGTAKPLAIIDMGAGSTDASIMTADNKISSCHLAGAGNMVTLLIDKELGINNLEVSEDIKKYPLAKVESLFHIRHEDGSVQFFEETLNPSVFARVVILKEGNMIPLDSNQSLEKIKNVRREAKEKVFVTNTLRALNFPTGFAFALQKSVHEFNVEKAKKLLDEAGYKDTDGDGYREKDGQKVSIELLSFTRLPEMPLAVEASQQQLKEVGIEATIKKVEVSAVASEKDYAFTPYAVVAAPIGDPYAFFNSAVKTNGAANIGHYSNPEADKKIEELATETDPAKRNQLSKEIQEIMDKDYGFTIIGFFKVALVMDKSVSGLESHPTDYYHVSNKLSKE